MQRFLILCLSVLSVGHISYAQTPVSVAIEGKLQAAGVPSTEMMCNDAGTFQFGQFIGQSNDSSPDTIFLCYKDSIFINHDGNGNFAGDPVPGTPSGIVYGFYTCPPAIMGPDLSTVIGDCFWLNMTTGLPNVAKGDATGDVWFSNSGGLLTGPNANGVQYWFAPMTIDNFGTTVYENTGGGPAGPCVNVNTNDAFSVVYLKEMTITGVATSIDGDACLGRFKIEGGWPAFDASKIYTVNMFKTSNPSVTAVLHTNLTTIKNNTLVSFSVNEPGTYTLQIEDGKSCGVSQQIVMTGCDTIGSVNIIGSNELGITGTQVCVPITAENVNSNNILTTGFSVNWDPAILSYVSTTSDLPGFTIANNLNEAQTGLGNLGFGYFDPSFSNLNVPNGDTLFVICFNVLGPVGSQSPIQFSGTPGAASTNDDLGNLIAPVFVPGSVLVVNPGIVSFTTALVNAACNGTAKIKITATGGTPPYTFNWTPGPGMGSIPNLGGMFTSATLTSGNYLITMTDALGMTSTGTVNIPTAALGASLNFTQLPSCQGFSNGIIRADIILNGSVVNNPGSQYTYSWSPATVPNPTGRIQTGVPQGFYSVTISDSSTGCTAVASGTLSEPAKLEKDQLQSQNAACSGVSNGSINYLVKGGTADATGNYEFDWTFAPTVAGPFTNFQINQITNPSNLVGLAAGVYRVTITDSNGCSFTDQVTITNQKTVSLTLNTATTPTCYGTATGAISVNVTTVPNTPGVYSYLWSPSPLGSILTNSATNSTLSMIPAGSYILTATENGTGCLAKDTFAITQPDSLKITANPTNPTCAQPMSGSIGLNVTGGGTSYSYAWAPAPPAPIGNQGSASNLPAGTYRVTVTDNLGCTKVSQTTLTIPNPPGVTLDSTSISCGMDGCVKATGLPIAGTTITGYQWSNQATGTIIGSTAQVCMLNGGNYIVTVTANDGCTVTDTMSLFQPNTLKLDTINYLLPSCFGYADGVVGVTISGGATPRTYAWSVPSPSVPSLVGVPAGAYTVTVSDANGCTLVVNAILNNPPKIVTGFANVQMTKCFGSCDGTAAPVVTYNTTPVTFGNFNFTWESGETDSIANQLCAGINHVTISDANNCFIIDSVIISQPPPIDPNFTITPPTCAGDCNGQVVATGAGGNGGPYIFDWGFTTNNPAQQLCADTFDVIAIDIAGCQDTFSVVIGEPNPVSVVTDFGVTTDVICTDDQNGVVAVSVTGGNAGGYTYDWSGGIGNTPVVTDLASGSYTVTVSDPLGCTGVSDPIIINNPPRVQGDYLPWEQLVCAGDQTTFEIDTIFGGAGGPYQFTIDYGVELPASFPVSITGGQHIITYLDRFGCSTDDTITVIPGIDLQVIFNQPTVTVELGDTLYQLTPTITGGIVDQFVWTPMDKVSDPSSLTPYANTFTSTTYTLMVTDPNGCTGEGSVYLKIDPNRNVYIPNAIAPTYRAGLNNRWKVFTGVGVDKVNFARVFDRWGELMYEYKDYKPNNDDYSEGWDGTFRGRYLDPGVFVYLVEVKFLDGRVLLYRGDITIVR